MRRLENVVRATVSQDVAITMDLPEGTTVTKNNRGRYVVEQDGEVVDDNAKWETVEALVA